MKSARSSEPKVTAGNIDPTMVRDGRTWAQVKAEIEGTLKGCSATVIRQELDVEANDFVKGLLLPIARARIAAMKAAVAQAPADQRNRVHAAFANNWT